jgi:hypothetical protein
MKSKSVVGENHAAFMAGKTLMTKGSLPSYRQGAERSAPNFDWTLAELARHSVRKASAFFFTILVGHTSRLEFGKTCCGSFGRHLIIGPGPV